MRVEQAGGVLVIINSLYMSYLIDLDNAYEPNEQTIAIHELVRPELSPLRAPTHCRHDDLLSSTSGRWTTPSAS